MGATTVSSEEGRIQGVSLGINRVNTPTEKRVEPVSKSFDATAMYEHKLHSTEVGQSEMSN